MIFVFAPVVALTVWQYLRMARRQGRGHALREMAVATVAGGASGILVGVGARIGMAAIGLANAATRFTSAGSFAVVVSFAGFGVILGIIYVGLLRRLVRRSGLAYGCLLVLCTWYPLAEAAVADLTSQPSVGALVLVSGVAVAGMWVPYAIVLERLIRCWHGGSTTEVVPELAV